MVHTWRGCTKSFKPIRQAIRIGIDELIRASIGIPVAKFIVDVTGNL